MKNLFSLIFTIAILSSVNAAVDRMAPYSIKSDKKDKSVPKGKTKITGVVYVNNSPLQGVRVSSVDHKQYAITNEKGEYRFLIKSSDTSLYAHQVNCEEIIIYKYDFKSQHAVEIDFYMFKRYIEPRPVRKPVIYLYPEKEQDISIILNPKGNLTFTYPQLKESWTVNASPNGELSYNNRIYPYLFWEAEQDNLTFTTNENGMLPGFLTTTDTIVEFLEDKLTQIGLNNKEQADFITFWAPQMINKKQLFIQFLIDDEYEQNISSMNITPKPTSTKRVYMLYQEIGVEDDFTPYIEQLLPSFTRKGYTMIEWGGTEIPSKINL